MRLRGEGGVRQRWMESDQLREGWRERERDGESRRKREEGRESEEREISQMENMDLREP